MKMHGELLNSEDVITVKPEHSIMEHSTFRPSELIKKLSHYIGRNSHDKWFFNGVECELLSPNNGWRKGKIRITVEFLPETGQPDSALDELRQLAAEEPK